MIATVKIASVEQWCESAKKYCSPIYAGKEVRIFAGSMQVWPEDYCGGRRWNMEQVSTNDLRALAGRSPVTDIRAICEHMLEMD